MDTSLTPVEKVRQPFSGYFVLITIVALLALLIFFASRNDPANTPWVIASAMVSNLMVVLCGDRESQPIVNTGTLNH